jgi:hypothetical protein
MRSHAADGGMHGVAAGEEELDQPRGDVTAGAGHAHNHPPARGGGGFSYNRRTCRALSSLDFLVRHDDSVSTRLACDDGTRGNGTSYHPSSIIIHNHNLYH